MTFLADALSLYDAAPSYTPRPAVGLIDTAQTATYHNVAAAYVCVETRDSQRDVACAIRRLRRIFECTGATQHVVAPFFHLSSRALVASTDTRVQIANDIFRALAQGLSDIGVAASTFGFHKLMTTTGFRLLACPRPVFSTKHRHAAELELLMCKSVLARRPRFWVFVSSAARPSQSAVAKAAAGIYRHWRSAAASDPIVISPGWYARLDAVREIARVLNCEVDDLRSCRPGLPEWTLLPEPAAIAYRSY